MSVCTRYHRNKEDAESLVNQSFLKIVINIKNYPTHIPFKLWIRKITVNTIIDEYRKNKKNKATFQIIDFQGSYFNQDAFDVNDHVKKSDSEEIYLLIMELPEMPQKVFNLYVIDGFTHKEIAQMLQIPEGTSRWYLNNAKEELKIKLLNRNIKNVITVAS